MEKGRTKEAGSRRERKRGREFLIYSGKVGASEDKEVGQPFPITRRMYSHLGAASEAAHFHAILRRPHQCRPAGAPGREEGERGERGGKGEESAGEPDIFFPDFFFLRLSTCPFSAQHSDSQSTSATISPLSLTLPSTLPGPTGGREQARDKHVFRRA